MLYILISAQPQLSSIPKWNLINIWRHQVHCEWMYVKSIFWGKFIQDVRREQGLARMKRINYISFFRSHPCWWNSNGFWCLLVRFSCRSKSLWCKSEMHRSCVALFIFIFRFAKFKFTICLLQANNVVWYSQSNWMLCACSIRCALVQGIYRKRNIVCYVLFEVKK